MVAAAVVNGTQQRGEVTKRVTESDIMDKFGRETVVEQKGSVN